MKSKNLLGLVQLAVMAAIGTAQLHQALPIMARLAHRTAAPLEQIVPLGVTPPSPRPPVPAVQPFVAAAAAIQVCDRKADVFASPVHVRHTVLHVEAPRPAVETIADPIESRFVSPRRVHLVRMSVPDSQAMTQFVRMEMNSAGIAREMARAQREIRAAMERAQRQAERQPRPLGF